MSQVDELVGALTEEEFKGKLLVILAGYDADMEQVSLCKLLEQRPLSPLQDIEMHCGCRC
eukprot:SAG22_NODE_123_length_18914_cov_28.993410_4_plen_60_part_00